MKLQIMDNYNTIQFTRKDSPVIDSSCGVCLSCVYAVGGKANSKRYRQWHEEINKYSIRNRF